MTGRERGSSPRSLIALPVAAARLLFRRYLNPILRDRLGATAMTRFAALAYIWFAAVPTNSAVQGAPAAHA